MKLYEVCEIIANCVKISDTESVDTTTGEIIDIDYLESLEMDKAEKIDYLIKLYLNCLSDAKSLKEEAQKFQKRAKTEENKAESIKNYLGFIQKGEKFKSLDGLHQITFRKTQSVEIEDISKLDECYLRYKDFVKLYIDEITDIDIQTEVNNLSADRKPKTVKNYYDFIVSVMRTFIKNYSPDVTLPEVMLEKKYIPTDKEVKLLFESAKNHEDGMFFIPVVLGSYGLRRSEILALQPEDIIDNVVYIKKSMVQNDDNEWIIKDYPKNSTSIRRIPIDAEIAAQIHKQGYVYNGHPNSITDYIHKFCDENNVQQFSLHKLRHYFCSRLISEGIDIKTTITMSGHSTDSVFKRIYLHEVDTKVQEASAKLDSILFGAGPKWSQDNQE